MIFIPTYTGSARLVVHALFLLQVPLVLTISSAGVVAAASDAFDVYNTHMLGQAELVTIETPETNQEIGSFLHYDPTFSTLHLEETPLLMEISATLVCRTGKVSLHLQQQAVAFDSTREIKERSLWSDVIPVYTRQLFETVENNIDRDAVGILASKVMLDNFPRLCTENCKTYRDKEHQAVMLVMHDPGETSLRFLGSFIMEEKNYFLQPYVPGAPTNTSEVEITTRLHVLENIPSLDFSADSRWISLVERKPRQVKDVFEISQTQNSTFEDEMTRSVDQTPEFIQPFDKSNSGINDSTIYDHIATDVNGSSATATTSTIASFGSTEDPREPFKKSKNASKTFPDVSTPPRDTRPTSPSNSVDELTVEVFYVCDFLCYEKFRELYKVVDPVITKNMIVQYFAYVREFQQAAYGGLAENFPELNLSVEIRVVGLYIAASAVDKIIGDYVIGDNKEVDTAPSLFEFALWVKLVR
ncbi:hypothetical protein PoB_002156500 [Plakobranchus ocellatus]|uniref:Uncharacterized protein n=1 Tax=Plakobranchus ocellatus TaxID=259542 RepID=A0AAV3ZHF5_9GAST|nr:hypothetical protein PoB_002156500 [Plakobranchus ocellatus]